MKILLADDDRLIRFSLRAMLEEIGIDSTAIYEADDGGEMVEQCAKIKPDLAFVDINMPVIDGIHAIETCKLRSEGTKFVILTAYAEFEYARKSIHIGVSDYLLKPVSTVELNEVVVCVKAEMQQKRKHLFKAFQLSMLNLTKRSRAYFSFAITDEMLKKWGDYIGFCLLNFDYPFAWQDDLFLTAIFQRLDELQEELFLQSIYILILKHNQNQVQMLILTKSERDYDIFYEKINSFFNRNENDSILISGLLTVANFVFEVREAALFLLEHPHLRFLFPSDRISVFSLKQLDFSEKTMEYIKIISNLAELFQLGDDIKFEYTFLKLKENFFYPPAGIHLLELSRYLSAMTGAQICGENYRIFFDSLERLRHKVTRSDYDKPQTKIHQIQQYIEHNYMKDISISAISERFGFTPNYLSALFSKKTGSKFIDYVTTLRIAKAKKIMINSPETTVSAIALQVGYSSPRHFTKLFKKQVGMSPSEYRKEQLTEKKNDYR